MKKLSTITNLKIEGVVDHQPNQIITVKIKENKNKFLYVVVVGKY